MDKLSVGIVLEPSYEKTAGGGYSYYATFTNYIDTYKFDDRLDVKFINLERAKPKKIFTRTIININYQDNSIRYQVRRFIISFFRLNFFKKLLIFQTLLRKLMERHNNISYRKIEGELQDYKIDLLYYLIPNGRQINYPYILTHWDNGHLSMFSFPEVTMNNTFENRNQYFKNVLFKAFAIFCESNAGKKELIRYTSINPERVFVVPIFPNSFSHADISDENEKKILNKYALSPEKYFFYPAQFWSHKNHYNLIIAFKKLQKQYPEMKLVLSGSDKGNLAYIKKVIQDLSLEGNVLITGFVSDNLILTFYRNAIALVMPTFLGPTNMPLLEANEIGCPVICSDLEGHRELLGENAYYIEPNNFETIYKGMIHFINTPKMVSGNKHKVFNVYNSLKELESIFLKLIPIRKTFGYDYKQF